MIFSFIPVINIDMPDLQPNTIIINAGKHIHLMLVSKGAKIRNQYNQVPHLTQLIYVQMHAKFSSMLGVFTKKLSEWFSKMAK